MHAEDDSFLIAPITKPRSGWTEAFREMARQGDDALIDPSLTEISSWDENDWEWS